jgi:hypothetical protein
MFIRSEISYAIMLAVLVAAFIIALRLASG